MGASAPSLHGNAMTLCRMLAGLGYVATLRTNKVPGSRSEYIALQGPDPETLPLFVRISDHGRELAFRGHCTYNIVLPPGGRLYYTEHVMPIHDWARHLLRGKGRGHKRDLEHHNRTY